MKTSPLSLLVISGMFLVLIITAKPRQMVSAQVCYDANKQVIPCPEQDTGPDKKKKKTPRPPIPTSTPTATTTPTPTPTPTPSPSPTPALVVAASAANTGGFACAPYKEGAPIGAAALAAGILAISLARPGGMLNPNKSRYSGNLRLPDSDLADVSRTALPMGGDSGGGSSGAGQFLLRWLSRLSPRDPASGLPSMNQQTGVAGGTARLIGTVAAGAGGGILGAALLGGLFDFSCISTNVVLPSGALLGVVGTLAAGLLTVNPNTLSPFARPEPESNDHEYSTFEMYGVINETYADGPSGSAGIYRDKDLE